MKSNYSNSPLHKMLIRVGKTHRRRVNIEFTKVNLTEGQPKILVFLQKNPGCIQREIADKCNIEAATVTSILAGMESAELIYRTRNEKDKRIYNVYLTEKGMKAEKEVRRIFKLIDDECFQGFTEEEKKETISLLERLYENMINEE